MKDTFTQAIRLGIIILVVALALGWADAMFFAPRRIPACVQDKLPPGRICLETLASQFHNRVVWVDARSQADFELNHLMLAENRMFPIRKGADLQQQIDAAIGRLLEAAENGEAVVVFCTGECTASEEIAAELRALGMIDAPVYVLEGGWEVLKASGMAAD
ncbi:MAG: rhodanese-like domain-containing protein [Akkermansia sp.]|nr:rhodanese-like domain-containing protein [Akkermansia sp.]